MEARLTPAEIHENVPDRVIGTHLFPLRQVGKEDLFVEGDQRFPLEVIVTAEVDGLELLFNRMSGIFTRISGSLGEAFRTGQLDSKHLKELDVLIERFVMSVNLVICELALAGFASALTSKTHVGQGDISQNDRAGLTSSGGWLHERTVDPSLPLFKQGYLMLNLTLPQSALEEAMQLKHTAVLRSVADTLPVFCAAAYASRLTDQLPEAQLNGWIAIEQIVASQWRKKCAEPAIAQTSGREGHGAHTDRLEDGRTYSASVMLEMLLAVGAIEVETYLAVSRARKLRNDLAHGAALTSEGPEVTMDALHRALVWICGESVRAPTEYPYPLANAPPKATP